MMNAEIISIGDEILIGQINNTNSVWLAQQLNLTGVTVTRMVTVADTEEAITTALSDTVNRARFVFITGGLGPTKDDVTKKVFSDFFGAKLVSDPAVLSDVIKFFSDRGREVSEVNRMQALVPEGCRVIRNSNGTAPGMWMTKNGTDYFSLPGVPYEMQGMVSGYIIPAIKKENRLPHIYHKTILTQGIGESAIAEIIESWEDSLSGKNIKLAYLPQPGMVRLRLSSSGDDEAVLKQKIGEEIIQLQSLIGKYIFGSEEYGQENVSLEKIVSEMLRSEKKTLALAESCTGGYLSSLITAIPGASEIFKGSIIPYTNLSKNEILNVNLDIFNTVGAVSKECVEALAGSALTLFGSDYAVAISGIAGPGGGTAEKPVGTVWIAVANREKTVALKFRFGDNRNRNIIMSANAALNMLRKFIKKGNI